jgi:hypothetical protein
MLDDDVHEKQSQQPTQPTRPKKGEPIEIPVPKEEDFEKLVRRAVPVRPEPDLDPAGGSED